MIKFNCLLILHFIEKNEFHKEMGRYVLARCDCGKEIERPFCRIKNNRIKSCPDCGRARQAKAIKEKADIKGREHKRLSSIYQNMKSRCYNKKVAAYKSYGARGITICSEWKNNKKAFVQWALDNGYNEKLSVDRVDNNRGYCPENCRWTTCREQTLNSRVRSNSVTGERCITPIRGKYQLTIDSKYHGVFTTISEAVLFRDSIINGDRIV